MAKRNSVIAIGIPALLAALAAASAVIERKAVVEAAAFRRRDLKWIPCGRSRCRTTGSWATPSACQSTPGSHLDHPPPGFARSME